jgi:hypothetical protein
MSGRNWFAQGAEPLTDTSTYMGEFIRDEISVWDQVAKAAGLHVQ